MSSRKGVGIGAFDRNRLTSAQYASHGSSLRSANTQALEAQLSVFRSLLQQFAQTHAKDIRSNPQFRAQFARMCSAIGVDPLSSSNSSGPGLSSSGGGSIWSQLLGRSVNDFYFELAVRVVEVCNATRGQNGGLIGLRELKDEISRGRREVAGDEISEDDILRAVATLKPLGSSYSVIKVGRKDYVRSVPRELNTDQSAVLEAAQIMGGYVTADVLVANLGWTHARATTAVDDLIGEGMLWVDKQARPWEYWSPSFMVEADADG